MKTWEIRYGLTEGAYKTTSNSHTPLIFCAYFQSAILIDADSQNRRVDGI